LARVDDCRLIELRSVYDQRGSISFVESGPDIPFPVRRVYLTYDIPSHATRAGHAHRALQQLYIAASGAFDVRLDDGHDTRTVTLNRPNAGLIIGPGIWRDLVNFSSNACLVVLASDLYDEADYIRGHADFTAAVAAGAFQGD
jgi:dTDP-4-dehydrorhamnose 3,5-epimerase-like enzyme